MKFAPLGLALALVSTTALAQTSNLNTSGGASGGASASTQSSGSMMRPKAGGHEQRAQQGGSMTHQKMGANEETSGSARIKGSASTKVEGRATVSSRDRDESGVSIRTHTRTSEGPRVSVRHRTVTSYNDEPSTTVIRKKKRYVHRFYDEGPHRKVVIRKHHRHYVEEPSITIRKKRHYVRSWEDESPSVSYRTRISHRYRHSEPSASVSIRTGERHDATRFSAETRSRGEVSHGREGSRNIETGSVRGKADIQGSGSATMKSSGSMGGKASGSMGAQGSGGTQHLKPQGSGASAQ